MPGLWRLVLRVRGAAAAVAASEILDGIAAAVSAFEAEAEAEAEAATEPVWSVEAYAPAPLLGAEPVATAGSVPELELRLRLAAAVGGGSVISLAQERLAERDWLAENRLAFPPLQIGGFWIHGSHETRAAPAGAIGLEIDAAIAFGTGEHPSTAGCLLALQRLARRRRFRRPLDIGTGTGILAIAAAKRLRRPVLASDIDPGSVRLARHNVRRNGVSDLVRVQRGAGYRGRTVKKARYDLVFANILARPLALMARDLSRRLAPGGRAVLSGLLRRQEPIVLAAHRGCRLVMERRVLVQGWSTLVLRSGRPGFGG